MFEAGVGGLAKVMQGQGLQIGERRELRKFREGRVARAIVVSLLDAQGFEAFQFQDRVQRGLRRLP